MINIYKLKLTSLQQEILRFLFIHAGKSFNARALALALEVTQPAISKALPALEDMKLITIKKEIRYAIALNVENSDVTGLKRADNLKLLYESGFVDYLHQQFPGTTIVLFGSFSNGEDTYDSDVDIAIVGIKPKKINLKKYEKIVKKEININYYTSFNKIDKHLRNNILNGITLKGVISLEKI